MDKLGICSKKVFKSKVLWSKYKQEGSTTTKLQNTRLEPAFKDQIWLSSFLKDTNTRLKKTTSSLSLSCDHIILCDAGEKFWFCQWSLCLIARQVTGLDGNYRITCHTVMEVLREHRDSVMAVLEAFVYDPLLNWRLMDSKSSSSVDIQDISAQ